MRLPKRLRRWIRDPGGVRVVALEEDGTAAGTGAYRPTVGTFVNVERGPEAGPYPCPCCGFLTLPTRGQFELCPVCFWEDDGQDDHDADLVRGGPNGGSSLTEARLNYAAFGASHRAFLDRVREPTRTERCT